MKTHHCTSNSPVLMHRDVAGQLADNAIDRVYLVGREVAVLAEQLPSDVLGGVFDNVEAILTGFIEQIKDRDTIMVKGSNGIKLAKLVNLLQEAST